MATAIEIINAACHELGLPTVGLNSQTGDTLGTQALALLNALGKELTKVHDWQFLMYTASFVGDGVASEFDLPADFGRQVNQTQWASNDKRPMRGPDSPQMWSWNQFGIVSVGVYYRYRIHLNKYEVFPVPGTGIQFDFYYISKNWALDQDPPFTPKDTLTKTGDTVLYDERLMITGLKVKLWSAKGFDTTNLQDEFNMTLEAVKGQNQGARAIHLDGHDQHLFINWQNVPESGFGN